MAERVTRYDRGTMSKLERLPSGAIRVPATLTRTGVFTYRRGDGSVSRELRLPDEVFSEQSVRSLRGVAITQDHPAERVVTPGSWRRLAVGHVENPRADGERFIGATLVVQDEAAIDAVVRGDLVEVSCGYTCSLELTSGVTADGEEYDGIQRGISHNHVALGRLGWARAGREARVHLDAADAVQECAEADGPPRRDDANAGDGEERTMRTVKIDGVDYQVDDAAAPHLERAFAAVTKRADDATDQVATVTRERDEARGRLDAVTAERDEARAASAPEKLAARVRARVELETSARTVLGAEAKLDGLSDREIMVAAIRKLDANAKLEQATDDYVRGRYEASVEGHRQDGRRATSEHVDSTLGGASEDFLTRAVREDRERLRNAGRAPGQA